MLHPVSSRASQTSGILVHLALSTITIPDSILTIDVTLDRQNVHYLCRLLSTYLLHFMTAEIASILRQCFDLVNYSLSSVGGNHHLWSETRQTGYSVGVTVRLESALSALDLVKKMERVKKRRSSNHATKDHPEEKLPKTFTVGFASIHISSNLLAKTLLTKCR